MFDTREDGGSGDGERGEGEQSGLDLSEFRGLFGGMRLSGSPSDGKEAASELDPRFPAQLPYQSVTFIHPDSSRMKREQGDDSAYPYVVSLKPLHFTQMKPSEQIREALREVMERDSINRDFGVDAEEMARPLTIQNEGNGKACTIDKADAYLLSIATLSIAAWMHHKDNTPMMLAHRLLTASHGEDGSMMLPCLLRIATLPEFPEVQGFTKTPQDAADAYSRIVSLVSSDDSDPETTPAETHRASLYRGVVQGMYDDLTKGDVCGCDTCRSRKKRATNPLWKAWDGFVKARTERKEKARKERTRRLVDAAWSKTASGTGGAFLLTVFGKGDK